MFGFQNALLCLTWLLVFICPFTKVEESFNMQALHDIAFLRYNLSEYDHFKFPGVVPRTFVGAVLLDLIASIILYMLALSDASKFVSQYVVRIFLGSINILCFMKFATAVRKKFGKSVYTRLCFITFTQFHFLFYASRSLPNSFALALVLLSLARLLRSRDKEFIGLAGFAILVFRSELMLFYGPCLLYGLVQGYVRLRPTLLLAVILTAIGSVGFSVIIDSIFWQQLIWPEGAVFYFNAVLNKSGEWGTSPFHWYYTSALPRALLATFTLVICWFPCALRSLIRSWLGREDSSFPSASTGLVVTGLAFVSLYSLLPHKELRFIIYAVPVFNVAAATFWSYIDRCMVRFRASDQKRKGKRQQLSLCWLLLRLISWFCYAHLLFNVLGTVILLMAARQNYPGGQALMQLNHFPALSERKDVHVHICNLAAQTGITRFLEEHNHWIYNKTEGIENDVDLLLRSRFTHLISEISSEQMLKRTDSFRPLFLVDGFDRIALELDWRRPLSFIQLRTSPHLTVYERTR